MGADYESDGTAEKRKKIIIAVILFSIFAIAALQIVNSMVSTYKQNKKATDKLVVTMDCSMLIFDVPIDQILYQNNQTVIFRVKNNIGEKFETLIVETKTSKYQFKLLNFDPGNSQKIIVPNVTQATSIKVYPDKCPNNAKTFEVK